MARAASTPPQLRGFTFVKPLGSGGFSDVYLYDQELPRRRVAVKVLLTEGLTAASREAFVAEANVMAQLSAHPYIVSIYTADVSDDGRPYFIMEYCSGPSLADRYKAQPFSVVETLRTGVRLSSAIATAHQAGILHRDIKPGNVLTNDFGWPALTDFGISSAVEDHELPLHTVTRPVNDSGSTTGSQSVGMSIPWSPPEMFEDSPRPDVRSDVFSLAATLYTLLAGRTPFEVAGGPNGALDLMGRIERGDITPLTRTDVPASLLAVLRKGMAIDRTDRFATAVDFARALQRVEIELDYAPTTIDVPNLVVPDVAIDRSTDDDATRARAVRTISAQAVPPSPAPAPAPAPTAPPAASTAPVAAPEATVVRGAAPDQTIRRSAPASTSDAAAEAEPVPTRGRGGLVAAVIVAALVVGGGAVGISAALGGAGPDRTPIVPSGGEPDALDDLDDVLPTSVSAPEVVSAEVQPDGSVLFTWQPSGDDPVDSYRWEQVSGGDAVSPPSSETTALVASESGGKVCIQVWAVRDGAQSLLPAEACGP